jgi:hypothetical protein
LKTNWELLEEDLALLWKVQGKARERGEICHFYCRHVVLMRVKKKEKWNDKKYVNGQESHELKISGVKFSPFVWEKVLVPHHVEVKTDRPEDY